MGFDWLFFREVFVTLFVVVNPIAVAALFVAMTAGYSRIQKHGIVLRGSLVATGVLLFFAFSGEWILKVLGISMNAFQIAGGVLLFTIGFSMLRAEDVDRPDEGSDGRRPRMKADLSVTPLAVPFLAGPGAISSIIIEASQAQTTVRWGMLLLAVMLVMLIAYWVLEIGVRGARFLNHTVIGLIYRISGLVLIALAVQFFLAGLEGIEVVAKLLGLKKF